MKKKLSKRDQKIVKNCIRYIRSKEGQAELKRVIDEADERTKKLRESQKVTWEMMNTPMTV